MLIPDSSKTINKKNSNFIDLPIFSFQSFFDQKTQDVIIELEMQCMKVLKFLNTAIAEARIVCPR